MSDIEAMAERDAANRELRTQREASRLQSPGRGVEFHPVMASGSTFCARLAA